MDKIKPEPLVRNGWLTNLTFISWLKTSIPTANSIGQFFQKLSCLSVYISCVVPEVKIISRRWALRFCIQSSKILPYLI